MRTLEERVQTNEKYITVKDSTMKRLRRDYMDLGQTAAYMASMKAVDARSTLYRTKCAASGLNPVDELRKALG